MKKNIKSQRGAVSTLVVITVLTFSTILLGAFLSITALRKAQLRSDIRIQEIYGKDLNRVDDLYEELTETGNEPTGEPTGAATQKPITAIPTGTDTTGETVSVTTYLGMQKYTKIELALDGVSQIGYSNVSKTSNNINLNNGIVTTKDTANTSDYLTVTITGKVQVENDEKDYTNNVTIFVEPELTTVIDDRIEDETEQIKPAYAIGTAQDLVRLAELVNNDAETSQNPNKNAKITADNGLDLSLVCHEADETNNVEAVSWPVIGYLYSDGVNDFGVEYNGIFDGNYRTISNLTIIKSDEYSFLGLFGSCGSDSIIKNTILNTANISNSVTRDTSSIDQERIGGICANSGGIIKRCAIKNSEIRNEYIGKGYIYTGGIVGSGCKGIIEECFNYNTNVISIGKQNETSLEIYSGGIVGIIQTGGSDSIEIQNCYNYQGDVSSSYGSHAHAGGISGRLGKTSSTASASIDNVYSCATITASNGKTLNYQGGVLGRNGWNSNTKRNLWNQLLLPKRYYN